jgi:glycosyltransferase involved in cell wall biosynthesis
MEISVYLTSYNQKRYLIEAIESVLAQSFKPFQIIIIDDCSSDGSQEIIAGFHSRYPNLITPIYHTQNRGITYTRIEALQRVTGNYVTFLDGDDRFLPTKLEKEANLLQKNPQAQIAFSNVYYVSEHGARTGVWAEHAKPPEGDVFCQAFARDFPRGNLFRSELVNYQAWKQVGFYDMNLHNLYEDYDMRIRLTKGLRVVYCDEPLSEYRRHNAGLSRVKFTQHFEALDYIYQKNKPLLNNLSKVERDYVNRKVGEWIARVAIRASDEARNEGQPHQAAKLLVDAWHYGPDICTEQLQRQAERLQRQAEQLQHLAAQNRDLNLQLSRIRKSWSWKITAPLRKVGKITIQLKE